MSDSSTPNPLSEASPASLEEIFATAPLERTDAEWHALVTSLQAMRDKWRKDELSGAKKASAPKKAPLKTAPKDLSLDDLGM